MLALFVYFLVLAAVLSLVFFLAGPAALLLAMGAAAVSLTAYVIYLNRRKPPLA